MTSRHDAPAITAAELNRATLARQMLLRREHLSVGDAVRRMVALQAQQPASPYLALWNRLADFDASAVDRAFTDGSLVKASLMRITLHAVSREDHPEMHLAMQPTLRGARLGDRRFTEAGLSIAEADALLPDLLAYAEKPRTTAQMQERIAAAATGAWPQGVWWAVRTYAPFRHVGTGGPWTFGHRPQYVASEAPLRSYDRDVCDVALQHLLHRYLEGFGPASVPDMAQFAQVQRSRIRTALGGIGAQLERLAGPKGQEMFDVAGAARPDGDVPAPVRLLPMWESSLLAYADRSRIIPERHRKTVIRNNGDVLPTVLVDGYVAGVWRSLEDGIEVGAFGPLPDRVWAELSAEADSLRTLLVQRDAQPYARYHRWWDKLPDGERRLVSAG